MIVLKTLCKEFDIDPPQLRRLLRRKFTPKQGRWQWQENDKQLKSIRLYLTDWSRRGQPPRHATHDSSSTA